MARTFSLSAHGIALAFLTSSAAIACEPVYFENTCHKDVEVLVEHAPQYRDWVVHAWYSIESQDRTRLVSNNQPICHLRDHAIYFYAESTDGDFLWSGDSTTRHNGVVYETMKAATRNYRGGTLVIISCDE